MTSFSREKMTLLYRFMSFLANLEWRRAVKHFGSVDASIDSSELNIEPVLNAMVHAPSSFGL